MIRIIDESNGLDMTAKFNLGQEIVYTNYQGYRKGTIVGISVNTNQIGTIFIYTVETVIGKKPIIKTKKVLEKHLFATVKDALESLANLETKEVLNETI